MKFNLVIKRNFIIYTINFLTIFFTYIFIILSLNVLDRENIYYFTGFIALLNILTIPLGSLTLGLSRLKNKVYINEKKKTINFLFCFSLIVLIINYIVHYIFNYKTIFNLKENHINLIVIIFFIHSLFSIKLSEILKKKKYELFALINFIPFFLRTIFLFIIYKINNEINIYSVLFIYLLSFLIFKDYKLIKQINLFWFFNMKIFLLNNSFFVNFISIVIVAIILNIDILAARSIGIDVANKYYIASLFGKVILINSLFLMPYIYRLNLKSQAEFNQIIFINILINGLIIIFYFLFFKFINIFLFPDIIVNRDIVLRICFFCFIFSISLNFSNRIIIKTYIHLIIKIFIIAIFLIIINHEKITIDLLLNYFTTLSLIFILIDLGFYLKFFSKKLNY